MTVLGRELAPCETPESPLEWSTVRHLLRHCLLLIADDYNDRTLEQEPAATEFQMSARVAVMVAVHCYHRDTTRDCRCRVDQQSNPERFLEFHVLRERGRAVIMSIFSGALSGYCNAGSVSLGLPGGCSLSVLLRNRAARQKDDH